jgi:hypothetical protein
MARYTVSPDPEGTGWAVYKNGARHYQKSYATKQAALKAAHRTADRGDSVQGRRVDGTYGPERTKGVFGPPGDR